MPSGLAPCVWAGNASAVRGAVFAGSARNTGSLGDYAGFYGGSTMSAGTVGDYAIFAESSGMVGGTVGDYAGFYGGSCMSGGTVGDYATFHDECWIGNGTVGDYATFNDDAEALDLSIGTGTTFNDSAFVYPDGSTTITLPVAIRTTFTGWCTYLAGSGSINLYGDGANSITYDLTVCLWDNPTLVCEYPWVAVMFGIILISGGDVRSGDPRYNSNVSGTLAVPESTNVLTGVATDDATGSLTLPAETQVLSGVEYGVGGDGSTGTLVSPAAVRAGDCNSWEHERWAISCKNPRRPGRCSSSC